MFSHSRGKLYCRTELECRAECDLLLSYSANPQGQNVYLQQRAFGGTVQGYFFFGGLGECFVTR